MGYHPPNPTSYTLLPTPDPKSQTLNPEPHTPLSSTSINDPDSTQCATTLPSNFDLPHGKIFTAFGDTHLATLPSHIRGNEMGYAALPTKYAGCFASSVTPVRVSVRAVMPGKFWIRRSGRAQLRLSWYNVTTQDVRNYSIYFQGFTGSCLKMSARDNLLIWKFFFHDHDRVCFRSRRCPVGYVRPTYSQHPHPETRNPKPEPRNPKPQTQSLKS